MSVSKINRAGTGAGDGSLAFDNGNPGDGNNITLPATKTNTINRVIEFIASCKYHDFSEP